MSNKAIRMRKEANESGVNKRITAILKAILDEQSCKVY
jgi:hypothetical protein